MIIIFNTLTRKVELISKELEYFQIRRDTIALQQQNFYEVQQGIVPTTIMKSHYVESWRHVSNYNHGELQWSDNCDNVYLANNNGTNHSYVLRTFNPKYNFLIYIK